MDKIELLSLEILETHKKYVELVDEVCLALNLNLGWHYILDIPWVLKEIQGLQKPSIVVDAGGGVGAIGWTLALLGHKIINVDFRRMKPSKPFTDLFPVDYLDQEKEFEDVYIDHFKNQKVEDPEIEKELEKIEKPNEEERLKEIERRTIKPELHQEKRSLLEKKLKKNPPHTITFYKSDFRDMANIPSESIDAIVSISAIEHTEDKIIKAISEEFNRILKPGGKMVIATSAAKVDWYHKLSKGWCFSEKTLRDAFGLVPEVLSNYDNYDSIFEKIKSSKELQERLAPIYFNSGHNGMPWGVWNPQYIPVGLVKTKEFSNQTTFNPEVIEFRKYNLLNSALNTRITGETMMKDKNNIDEILQDFQKKFSKKLDQLTPDTLVDKIIEEKNQEIQKLNSQVQSKDQKIQELNNHINHINLVYNSYSFKIGFFITRMITRLFGWLPFIKRRLKSAGRL